MDNRYTCYNPPPLSTISVLFQDAHLLLANKPAGLLSVPGNSPEKKDCMVSRCAAKYGELHIAHRLDMSTSGIIAFARSKEAVRGLNKQFAERKVHKTYIAVVDGLLEQDHGEINAPLMVDWERRPRQMISEKGRHACTRYQVLSRDKETNTTRVQLTPITGRSHQLRVHMMSIGHAILGDEFYASDEAFHKADRLLLHAAELKFVHPITGQPIQVDCPPAF